MISKELKEWKYYYDKFPLYFKNDENIIEHFKPLYDLLVTNDSLYEKVFEYLDIFNADSSLYNEDSGALDVLRMLGAIYGVSDDILFDFTLTIENGQVVYDDTQQANIHLSPEAFLILVKAQIFNNNYNGTYEDMNNFYESIIIRNFAPLHMINGANAGDAILYINVDPDESELDIYYLLYAGLLTIKSLGISYEYRVGNTANYMYWGTGNEFKDNFKWDTGAWA